MRAINDTAIRGLVLLASVAGAVLSGCAAPPPEPNIAYYLSSPERLRRIHRVVFVELGSDQDEQVARDMTESLYQALRRSNLFRVQLVKRSDPRCRDLPLENGLPQTFEQLAAIRKALKSDTILVGSVSQFRPYPRMRMGLYLRLLDLRRGTLTWGVDHVWDTTDRATELRIRRFFERQMRSGYGPAEGRLGLISPRAFEKFIAHEVVGTLPARTVTSPPTGPQTPGQPLPRIGFWRLGRALGASGPAGKGRPGRPGSGRTATAVWDTQFTPGAETLEKIAKAATKLLSE